MPSYTNGYIPMNLLIVFKTGHNKTDGDWYHALSPATYAKHCALVELARRRSGGRILQITDGFGAYRPMFAQVIAEQLYGKGAATPGKSSHGGTFEGRQTLAMDYGNWAWVYELCGGWESFKADCTAVGLWAGAIMPERGYPKEQWHVVDTNPWGPVPTFAFMNARPFTPETTNEPDEEDAMRHQNCKDRDGDLYTLLNTATGKVIQSRDNGLATGWAKAFGNARTLEPQELINALAAAVITSSPGVATVTLSDEQLKRLGDLIAEQTFTEGEVKALSLDAIRERLNP